jgi:hypothetical protein
MGKYTFGVFLAAPSTAVLVAVLSGSIAAGMASSFLVFGLAYMVTGLVENIIKTILIQKG